MKRVSIVPSARTAVSSKFGRYTPEKEHIIRIAEVKKDKAVEELNGLYRETWVGSTENTDASYNRMANPLKNHSYSAADIERFSIALVEFQEEGTFPSRASLFLSALINTGKDRDYVIHTRHLSVPLTDLGSMNTKNITVKGNAGSGVGFRMKGGIITVEGNAGSGVGKDMEGGTITVEGTAGSSIGQSMNAGTITVKGNADYHVGERMKGGTIIVKGNAGLWVGDWMEGGTIIVEGNAGNDVGLHMETGAIIVEGDAGEHVGESMKGGTITVKGNVGACLGGYMEGGTIIVEGNAGRYSHVGMSMRGGEIHVEGEIASIGGASHGKIYHKGKLIVDK